MSITIISRDSELGLTQKKLEGYKKYSEIIQWGRKNPVKFAETFLGVTQFSLVLVLILVLELMNFYGLSEICVPNVMG